ncbi:AarF/ABC1/UbiB kinase family protein [Sandarakinorhabdus sp.]|uniref:ABC1 kinase family protein n=1 Tax=Sandarakinorhabdus sp. TaxID=1916663 RepID=UPI00286E6B43|nr:AarF/ABC1/UbiB kinase family protein [Sandarakinorhabdus sp.]
MAFPPIKSRAVPSSRLARLAGFGRIAGGLAGSVIGGGAGQLVRGQRPNRPGLLLTPGNARRLADELSRLRGAAMKMGQLLSMDAGELLPPELSDIMSRLRADAAPMPDAQLEGVLTAAWGAGWEARFQRFDRRPIAAASIGQVHRAMTHDGRDLAIKVQYPGVRASIDADVDNVATLIRMSGLLPAGLDVAPLLAAAKQQLHQEADYTREAQCLAQFGALLAGNAGFQVPALMADLSTDTVLAMEHVGGVAVESLGALPQAQRDAAISQLLSLVLSELFDWGVMQTDPNFANYRYDLNSGRLILLDFGATRDLPAALVTGYRAILRAGLAGDETAITTALMGMGLIAPQASPAMRAAIFAMVEDAFAPLRSGSVFDFGATDMAMRLKDQSIALAAERAHFSVPPADFLLVQRKFGGMYLLASRLKARVNVAALMAPYL